MWNENMGTYLSLLLMMFGYKQFITKMTNYLIYLLIINWVFGFGKEFINLFTIQNSFELKMS